MGGEAILTRFPMVIADTTYLEVLVYDHIQVYSTNIGNHVRILCLGTDVRNDLEYTINSFDKPGCRVAGYLVIAAFKYVTAPLNACIRVNRKWF
jgi:hypothetical protein